MGKDNPFKYRVGFLGTPNSREGTMVQNLDWTKENLCLLQDLGFNTIQINIAWGCRPNDEPLNLEDIVVLSPELSERYPQPVPLRSDPSPGRFAQRRQDMWDRIKLCRELSLRPLFHFGAPYNAHCRYGDGPPNCISDPLVTERYELLLEKFASEFQGVEDLLIYTYDQDAWLCSEFGPCPRCLGIPLHERLVPFLERLASKWQTLQPGGRVWWEPWELSAGQVTECAKRVCPKGLGLSLHPNIAEAMSTHVVDRWLKNTIRIASERGIPAIVEYFLGAASEELEPFLNLSNPQVIFRALKTISSVEGVCGIKEYYGLNPTKEDPNLRMTGMLLENPNVPEENAVHELSKPYGPACDKVAEFWRLASEGMQLFPWDTSWYIREIGYSKPAHSLSAAMLRGQQCRTPSWCSTRHSIFMKTDDGQPDPWMLEDVQLRCEQAAEKWQQAIELGRSIETNIPEKLRPAFTNNLTDLVRLRCRACAYAYHLRITNLAKILRNLQAEGHELPERIVSELLETMKQDLANYCVEREVTGDTLPDWDEMKEAIRCLEGGAGEFLETYLCETPNKRSKGPFSVTSR